jgi:P27 family predicted phage terminase small subunit
MISDHAPPSWLCRTGKAYWRRVVPSLIERGVLNSATCDLLSTAAQAYASYRESQEKLRTEGRVITTHTGAKKVSPWMTVEKQAFEILARVYKELSIAAPNMEDDEFDKWLSTSTMSKNRRES